MSKPSVCILVLNWNGGRDTIACLDSLKLVRYENFKTIVIDNGSSDDSVTRIKKSHSDIEILELSENLLYGGGNNAGLEHVKERKFEYVVFLNNDTTVNPDFLEPLVKSFQEGDKVGMAAPLMCYSADPDLVWYGGGLVNLWTGQVAHQHIRESIKLVNIETVNTDYITGCCLMLPTKLALQLGGFDSAFKMYGEDVDLSLRCKAAGFQLMFVPRSKIFHKVSASVGGEFSIAKLKRKFGGLVQIYLRHARWYQWPSILISQLLYSFSYISTFFKHRGSSV